MPTAPSISDETAPTLPPAAMQAYGLFVGALAVGVVGNLLLRLLTRNDLLPHWAALPLALLTAAPMFAAMILGWRTVMTEMDELLRRVVLEGLAMATAVLLPLSILYLNLRAAGVWTPRLDPPELLLGPALLVFLGITIAWRRYR